MILTDTLEGTDLIHPVYQVVYINHEIDIKCNSYGPTTWFKDGDKISNEFLKENNVYIQKASNEHSGVYNCEGKTSGNNIFSKNAKVLIAGNHL